MKDRADTEIKECKSGEPMKGSSGRKGKEKKKVVTGSEGDGEDSQG